MSDRLNSVDSTDSSSLTQSETGRIKVSCCNWSFSTSSHETAIRAWAKHLEEDHGIPREATAKWLRADALVRDATEGEQP